VALIGTAVYFSVAAADRSDEVSRFFGSGGRWNDQLQSIESDGRNDFAASVALYSIGGALGVTGTSLLIVYGKRER
jgi:hypothetical protein